ncbi:hypothetical protein ASPVEDRAFT_80920 [Aspergillus versicolor CBS 583.65]|uniref:Succinate-semialdehyde dehydrogenase, mitochondrial n=1 Tax=Aspergillus versicolor CBS 583.65 TaxID=1036611 RepID=A0A1L9PCP7_ASPVE|nr:uncharacterized protein ASPVEDRAFT_80920 [Aspergillus versicolor CBS 583.65]OJI99307.1 hypothetical protein ASPVEDRAFT_80920 [Aspergillus versicolor CBS 583.65]
MFLQEPLLLPGVTLASSSDQSTSTFQVIDPATSHPIATLADSTPEHCHTAITNSLSANEALRSLNARARASLLLKWYTLVLEAETDLATIITAENGKTAREARDEVKYAAEFLFWFAGEAQRVYGNVIPSSAPNTKAKTIHQPIGLVSIINPWNFPAAMVTRKVGAAFAAGCACILKPATETPLTAIALATLAVRAGFPEHALQFSFTGSTAVGKMLAARCMNHGVKQLSLELGGNAPVVVFEDANVDKAVEGIMVSKFRLSGQTCVCANRVFVHSSIYGAVVKRLVERIRAELKLGKGDEEGTTMGPLISAQAAEKVAAHMEDAVQRGAKVVVGGGVSELGAAFFEPTVLVDVSPGSICLEQETFGPLVPVVRFDREDEVVHMANRVAAGLAGYIFTESIARAERVSEALEVGMIGVNTGKISDPAVPFGGIKESGIGREGSWLGIHEYLQVKSITTNISP